MRVVSYIRVSTDEQKLGIEAQRDLMAQYCKREGLCIDAEFIDENVSGGLEIDKRPALLQALDFIALNKGSTLIVAKRCRLARNGYVAAMVHRLVERDGGKIQCADGVANGDSPEDQLLRGMLNIFAQYERELIRARTRAAMAAKKRKGEFTGGKPPYGFDVDSNGKLRPSITEQSCIKLVVEMRSKKHSLRKIAKALTERGITSRGNGKWNHMRVKTVLLASERTVELALVS
jgi:DNA invertase Pin-like site-specific DNA recombinase